MIKLVHKDIKKNDKYILYFWEAWGNNGYVKLEIWKMLEPNWTRSENYNMTKTLHVYYTLQKKSKAEDMAKETSQKKNWEKIRRALVFCGGDFKVLMYMWLESLKGQGH